MNRQIDLLIVPAGDGGKIRRHSCDALQQVDVRELGTQSVIHIAAREVSVYRHTLLLDGTAYKILNIFKLA